MPDREKLIKAWEIFRDSNPYQICEGKEFRAFRDPEYCMGQMIADTIDLLKEQEHSETFIVIDNKTGEEANPYNIALYEDWAKHLCYCDMEGWAIEDDGTLLLVDECGRLAYADRERFKVKWG